MSIPVEKPPGAAAIERPARRGAKRATGTKAAKSPRKAARQAPVPGKARFARASDEIARQLFKAYRRVEVAHDSVLAEAQVRGIPARTLEELREVPLAKREALATMYIKMAKIWATGHGTSLGAAGVVTMAADIAALVAVNLRMIQQVALAYGVPPGSERVDAWAILLSALGEPIDIDAARVIPGKQAALAATNLISETASMFARRLLRSRNSAGRAVPLVGAVFGGLSNYAFTAEVANRAREYYRSLAP